MSLHLPEMAVPSWHAMPVAEAAANEELQATESAAQQPRTNTAAWTILSLSLAVFACGAVLLAWSLIGQRDDLWSIGLPLALIGQAGMILGLVLQVESISGRRAVENRPVTYRRPVRAAGFSASDRCAS